MQWKPFNDKCFFCEDDIEIYTDTMKNNCAEDGDEVKCVSCGAHGNIVINEMDTEEVAYALIDWVDPSECNCDYCKKQLAEFIEKEEI